MSDALSFNRILAPSDFNSFRNARSAPAHQGLHAPLPPAPHPAIRLAPPPVVPRSMAERMSLARERIRSAAQGGQRMRSYEVALDLDMSEFHFARQFRIAFGRSPHVFYDEVRAECASTLLRAGHGEGEVARRVGFRRPAELRALLSKRGTTPELPKPAW